MSASPQAVPTGANSLRPLAASTLALVTNHLETAEYRKHGSLPDLSTAERRQLSLDRPVLAELDVDEGRDKLKAFEQFCGPQLLPDAMHVLRLELEQAKQVWLFERDNCNATFRCSHLFVNNDLDTILNHTLSSFTDLGMVLVRIARYEHVRAGGKGTFPLARDYCPDITRSCLRPCLYERTGETSVQTGRSAIIDPVQQAKLLGLDTQLVLDGLALPATDPHALALAVGRCVPPFPHPSSPYWTTYGGQAIGRDGGGKRKAGHDSLTAPRDSTTGEVNLAWAAIHGNPDFAGKAFHDEPFDDGDEAAISHADRYMPDTPSTEMHAMASFTFAESHALVDLQEQIVIESARGWQRVSRVQFEASKYGSGFFHVPGQGNLLGVNAKTGFGIGRSSASGKPEDNTGEHVQRVKTFFDRGIKLNKAGRHNDYPLPVALALPNPIKLVLKDEALEPLMKLKLGVADLRLKLGRDVSSGKLVEKLIYDTPSGTLCELDPATIQSFDYHTQFHLARILVAMDDFNLPGASPKDFDITVEEIEAARLYIDSNPREGKRGTANRHEATLAPLGRVEVRYLSANNSTVEFIKQPRRSRVGGVVRTQPRVGFALLRSALPSSCRTADLQGIKDILGDVFAQKNADGSWSLWLAKLQIALALNKATVSQWAAGSWAIQIEALEANLAAAST
ncbi:hypothetical protein JCM8208_004019 [Rhodotorula glutinis]